MFTGIIVATGRLAAIAPKDGDLELGFEAAALDLGSIRLGDSVSVQGTCLTVTRKEAAEFYADVSRETLAKTTLGTLAIGSRVNLEPSLRAGDPLGGHLVSGHVDAVGTLVESHADARSWRLKFSVPREFARFIAPKGSICLDGVSLTVNAVAGPEFDVNIIPHTYRATTLGDLAVGGAVNVEIDLIARYLDRLINPGSREPDSPTG
jgi:riboflavin synthase